MFTASPGGDTLARMRLSHQEAQVTDWISVINGRLSQIVRAGQANQAFGGGHDDCAHGQRRSSTGMGGMLAAGAAGVAAHACACRTTNHQAASRTGAAGQDDHPLVTGAPVRPGAEVQPISGVRTDT